MRSVLAAALLVSRAVVASPPDMTEVLAAAETNYWTQYASRVERLLDAMFEPVDDFGTGQTGIEAHIELLAARSGDAEGVVQLIDDGATLRDGGNDDPSAGDRLKVRFTANRACYVYAIGIDASGRVTALFPDANARATNPVDANRDYVMPEGDAWWGLDARRGVEQILMLASVARRGDIEDLLAALGDPSGQTRMLRSITRPIPVAPTRGIVTVRSAPVASRWFVHE